jgi:hypothetical protein
LIYSLYNDTVTLEFDERRHRYSANGEWVPSVTSILKIVSKGDALLQWGVNVAVAFLRENLKGEISSDDLDRLFLAAKYAHRNKKEEAADIGTMAHRWIEGHLRGETNELPANEAARNACNAALDWLRTHSHEPVAIEQRVYSKRHNFAGTLDYLSRVDGNLCLVDWKSSSGLWPEYFLQTSAYVAAYEEEHKETISGRWLIRIDKATGLFDARFSSRSEQRKDYKAFLAALTLFKRHKELETLTKKGATHV